MRRPAPLTAWLLSIICLSLFVTSTMAACSHNQRADTIKATLVSINAARDGLTTYDAQHQREIVDAAQTADEAREKIASYRAEREKIINGFEVVYRALALAATQNDQPSLESAISRAAELYAAVQKFLGKEP